tara:strand:+ start:4902 stop:5648 length:747 start_codon:yes stop_codon:yes gene_type:complete
MKRESQLIYEGKAKKIFATSDPSIVLIEFKDDATAFNSLKKSTFTGKGALNCNISKNIFKYLIDNNIPTHFIRALDTNSFLAQKINIFPIEVVLRNVAYGSICKQTSIKPGKVFDKPLLEFYFKNDDLNDPLLTVDRIKLMNLITNEELEEIKKLTLKVNSILKSFFFNIKLKLVDFKLEFGKNSKKELVLADEFSPDNCRLWDLEAENGRIKSLDKDRFRNDLGNLIEGYSEINTRINNFISSTENF